MKKAALYLLVVAVTAAVTAVVMTAWFKGRESGWKEAQEQERQRPSQPEASAPDVPASQNPDATARRNAAVASHLPPVTNPPAATGRIARPVIEPPTAVTLPAAAAPLVGADIPPVVVVPVVPPPSRDSVQYTATLPGSGTKVTIEGTSSLHPWKMEGVIISGTVGANPRLKFDGGQPQLSDIEDGLVATASAAIPVRSIKSSSPKMDEVYRQHMEEAKFRSITAQMVLNIVTNAPTASATSRPSLVARGYLAIHGVTNFVEMPATLSRLGTGNLKISGRAPLKMTDYKVNPPNPKIPGMPEIKTGNEVIVSIDWVVEPKR